MELANELFRQLQYFDHIAVRITAIRKDTTARHFERTGVESHAGGFQTLEFRVAIVDLETDMAQTGLGNAAQGAALRTLRSVELEEFELSGGKANHHQTT